MSNTIEGFENLTKQQLFDMSAKHILTTKQKSVKKQAGIKGNVCVYGGSGCAASVFLTESAKKQFDNFSGDPDIMGGGAWSRLVGKHLVPNTNFELIMALQYAHDNSPETDKFMDSWVATMRKLAKSYDLDSSVLEQAND